MNAPQRQKPLSEVDVWRDASGMKPCDPFGSRERQTVNTRHMPNEQVCVCVLPPLRLWQRANIEVAKLIKQQAGQDTEHSCRAFES